MHDAARYGCFPSDIFSPYRSAKFSAFFGRPTWSPKTKTSLSLMAISEMGFPFSSRTMILASFALVFISVSKLVLCVFMPGWVLSVRSFFRICFHVSWSVRTSWSVAPSIFRCSGGVGGPFSIVWKITSLRMAWDRKRLATAHS